MRDEDRRRYPRACAEIACKCRRSARTLYTPGRTIDVSDGGAAIEIATPRACERGERLALAFEHPECIVAHATRMLGATVVRTGPIVGGRQRVAVAFDHPLEGLAALGCRRAA